MDRVVACALQGINLDVDVELTDPLVVRDANRSKPAGRPLLQVRLGQAAVGDKSSAGATTLRRQDGDEH
jgi:hypothetical protein